MGAGQAAWMWQGARKKESLHLWRLIYFFYFLSSMTSKRTVKRKLLSILHLNPEKWLEKGGQYGNPQKKPWDDSPSSHGAWEKHTLIQFTEEMGFKDILVLLPISCVTLENQLCLVPVKNRKQVDYLKGLFKGYRLNIQKTLKSVQANKWSLSYYGYCC